MSTLVVEREREKNGNFKCDDDERKTQEQMQLIKKEEEICR